MGSLGDVVAGGLGGLACVLAGQPFDTIKVKMQTYPHLYNSTYQAFRTTFTQESLRGFYAGSLPAIASNIAENAVLFLVYNQCLKLVQNMKGVEKQEDLTVVQKASGGALASMFSAVAITPPDQIKCKMQAHVQLLQAKLSSTRLTTQQLLMSNRITMWTVLKDIIHEDGVRGLFRGLTSTWVREVPGYFLFFGGYHFSRQLLTPRGKDYNELGTLQVAFAGGLAGCCFWIPIFPSDTVKSRIQVQGKISGSFWKTLFAIVRNEGVLVLYKGLLATVVRSFPANGALFVTYEYSRQYLSKFNQLQ